MLIFYWANPRSIEFFLAFLSYMVCMFINAVLFNAMELVFGLSCIDIIVMGTLLLLRGFCRII